MIKIEIKIDGRPVIIPYNIKQGDFINKAIISHVIQNFKESYKEKKIKFIRYLNQEYDAWMLLNENEDLEIKNDLQILVKLKDNNLDKNQILKKKKIIGKIKNLCKKIDQEVSKLDKQKDIKDYRPSKTYNESPSDKESQASWFYLDGRGTTYSTSNGWQKQIATSTNKSKYEWLFDYTDCSSMGCSHSDNLTNGYWTSTPITGYATHVWVLNSTGYYLHTGNADANNLFGVRPVITLDKKDLK